MSPLVSEPAEKAQTVDQDVVSADISSGRDVLMLESRALVALADHLDARFHEAVEIILALKGRVIVTGMGKSGHIARKIAATFASTGTPSQYVHPGEASHGDLGMITADDAILALSNSGETQELGDLLEFAKRFQVPLIAITSRGESTLASYSTVALVIPDMPEAGQVALAPTTSTTMTLALGDALSVTVLERKGFNATDFGLFHPGGKLGRQLLRVGQLMHEGDELPLIDQNEDMKTALVTMTSKRFGCAGAVDGEGNLIGIVTDGDLRRKMSPTLLSQPVRDVMTKDPLVTEKDVLAAELIGLMNERQISAIFVVENGKPVGIMHLHDLIRAGFN